jgi:2-amino-4-hydroxy-6-hydroxymethyldihydropteridine diphosphokinase
MKNIIFLALGSNMGDRQANLETAIQSLGPKIRVLKRSSIYETPPWGFIDQPAFLNMVIEAETSLSPEKLLKFIKTLEIDLGRKASFRNGPRLIDLDILFFDQLILNMPGLNIPHPRLHERGFVLAPLVEIAPDFNHPILKIKMRELLANADCNGITLYFPNVATGKESSH